MSDLVKNPGGRPRLAIQQKDLRIIEEMAGYGARLTDIAAVIGVSDSTLDRWLEDEDVRAHWQRGRIQATQQVAGTLFKLALEGEVAACIFWLKSQAGWTDKPREEVATNSQVVFYLPDNGRSDNA